LVLDLILGNDQATFKMLLTLKVVKSERKIIILPLLIAKFQSKSRVHSVLETILANYLLFGLKVILNTDNFLSLIVAHDLSVRIYALLRFIILINISFIQYLEMRKRKESFKEPCWKYVKNITRNWAMKNSNSLKFSLWKKQALQIRKTT